MNAKLSLRFFELLNNNNMVGYDLSWSQITWFAIYLFYLTS